VHLLSEEVDRRAGQLHDGREYQRGSHGLCRGKAKKQNQNRSCDDACADAGQSDSRRNDEAEYEFHRFSYRVPSG
jgi:hypothetical protein